MKSHIMFALLGEVGGGRWALVEHYYFLTLNITGTSEHQAVSVMFKTKALHNYKYKHCIGQFVSCKK